MADLPKENLVSNTIYYSITSYFWKQASSLFFAGLAQPVRAAGLLRRLVRSKSNINNVMLWSPVVSYSNWWYATIDREDRAECVPFLFVATDILDSRESRRDNVADHSAHRYAVPRQPVQDLWPSKLAVKLLNTRTVLEYMTCVWQCMCGISAFGQNNRS